MAIPYVPKKISMRHTNGMVEHFLATNLYEGLATLAPDTLEVVGGVAQKWTISGDRRTYLFYLRPDTYWSNGVRVTAGDFIRGWRQVLLEPDRISQASLVREYLDSTAHYLPRKIKPSQLKIRAQALSDSVLRVSTSYPISHFLELLTLPVFYPMPPEKKEAGLTIRDQRADWVGNGPFLLDEVGTDFVRLRKNFRYWGKRQVQLSEVYLKVQASPTSVFQDFHQGNLDWSGLVDMAGLLESSAQKPRSAYAFSLPHFRYLRFDPSDSLFQQIALRRALGMTIGRKMILNYVSTGTTYAGGFVPPWISSFSKQARFYDQLDLARQEFLNLGYCLPDSPPRVCRQVPSMIIVHQGSDLDRKIAYAIRYHWAKYLGLNVEVRDRSRIEFARGSKSLVELVSFRPTLPGVYAAAGRWPDWTLPENLSAGVSSANGSFERPSMPSSGDMTLLQRGIFLTPVFKQQLKKFLGTTRSAVNQARFVVLAQEMAALMPVIPVVYTYGESLVRPSVLGFYKNALDIHPLKYIYFKGGEGTVQGILPDLQWRVANQ